MQSKSRALENWLPHKGNSIKLGCFSIIRQRRNSLIANRDTASAGKEAQWSLGMRVTEVLQILFYVAF